MEAGTICQTCGAQFDAVKARDCFCCERCEDEFWGEERGAGCATDAQLKDAVEKDRHAATNI